jgi:anti-sigma regulatory factor (Ser/Thr protein kinase)
VVGGTAVAERAWCVVVPHHARGARAARHRLASELRPLAATELLADAVAVIAELVGNAIRHATPLPGDVIRVAWRIRTAAGRQQLEVRVTDGGAGGSPQPREAGPDSVDGRGLAIVAALAETWGVERDGLGQSVWARLSRPVPAEQRVAG